MSKKIIYPCEYPWNLLLAIRGRSRRSLPSPSAGYKADGLVYVLSLLKESDRELLRLRYQEGKTPSEAASHLGLSLKEFQTIEKITLEKLRSDTRWGYIRWGIAGYMRKRIQEEYQRAYHEGYCIGYRKGTEEPHGVLTTDILDLPLETLGLSPRAFNCLEAKGYQRIGDIVDLKEMQIRFIRNMGRKTGQEIGAKLQSLGIYHTDWDFFLTAK